MSRESFFELSPDKVLDAVESAIQGVFPGVRATGRSLALNSLENRVYEIELDNAEKIVAKFYRPDRWTGAQILEEHHFVREIAEVEVPVVQPFDLVESPHSELVSSDESDLSSLALSPDKIFFAVFPHRRGRILGELDDQRYRILGRYLARIHAVGARTPFRHRLSLNVETYGERPLKVLRNLESLKNPMGERYLAQVEQLLNILKPFFEGVPMQAVHGDCHLGNTLWNDTEPFFLDFDDAVMAPPVQDIWMIVRGRGEEADRDRQMLINAYEEMRDFDRSTLHLIEPLRALRMIHFSAWIASRWEDPSFPKCFPNFGSLSYWQEEIVALDEIQNLVLENNY